MSEENGVSINNYEANKQWFRQNGKPMSKFKFNQTIGDMQARICGWIWQDYTRYLMLLCNERKDYTLFHIRNFDTDDGRPEFKDAIIDCLNNRGVVYDIHLTEAKDAYEIWLKTFDDDDFHVYYLFRYDNGVIEIGE